MESSALVIVDVQNDFSRLNGTLRVPGGYEVVDPIVRMAPDYDIVIATQDWHPLNHVSFKTWPMHCVQNTEGAELVPPINLIAQYIVRKGMDPKEEEYSGAKGVGRILRTNFVGEVAVVGLATDYCVKQTAIDLASEFNVVVPLAACRGIDNVREAVNDMLEAGVLVK